MVSHDRIIFDIVATMRTRMKLKDTYINQKQTVWAINNFRIFSVIIISGDCFFFQSLVFFSLGPRQIFDVMFACVSVFQVKKNTIGVYMHI